MSRGVTVICYRQKEYWESREAALDFYMEGVRCCDGAERERYMNVVLDIMDGLDVCTDGRD